jgi:hypothetical protein
LYTRTPSPISSVRVYKGDRVRVSGDRIEMLD